MTLKDAFTALVKQYGTHSAAAIALGYTPEHYRALRNGRVRMPSRTTSIIISAATSCAVSHHQS
ncbi:MAG: hypothetical protein R3Y11_09575 [Pseudomonadota bacterium]